MGIEILVGLLLGGGAAMASQMGKSKGGGFQLPKVSQDIGDLGEDEAKKKAKLSLSAMRAATYFTSPTGVLGQAPTRGARLTGA